MAYTLFLDYVDASSIFFRFETIEDFEVVRSTLERMRDAMAMLKTAQHPFTFEYATHWNAYLGGCKDVLESVMSFNSDSAAIGEIRDRLLRLDHFMIRESS